eukprot:gene18790-19098_t
MTVTGIGVVARGQSPRDAIFWGTGDRTAMHHLSKVSGFSSHANDAPSREFSTAAGRYARMQSRQVPETMRDRSIE